MRSLAPFGFHLPPVHLEKYLQGVNRDILGLAVFVPSPLKDCGAACPVSDSPVPCVLSDFLAAYCEEVTPALVTSYALGGKVNKLF